MLKKIMAVVCVAIGLIVVVLGASFDAAQPDHSPSSRYFHYSSSGYNVSGASFGADFYTYTYRGIDTIVDALDGVNKAAETVVKAEDGIYTATVANVAAVDALNASVRKIGKLIVVAIGLMIVAFGLYACSNVFGTPAPLNSDAAQATVAPDPLTPPDEATAPEKLPEI